MTGFKREMFAVNAQLPVGVYSSALSLPLTVFLISFKVVWFFLNSMNAESPVDFIVVLSPFCLCPPPPTLSHFTLQHKVIQSLELVFTFTLKEAFCVLFSCC